MTTRELQEALLNHYLLVMEMIKDENHAVDILIILSDTFTSNGLCFCAQAGFKEDIYDEGWINKNKAEGSGYWATPAKYAAADKTELLKAFQIRVDILNKILHN
jgi:hypothetical protein